METKNISPLHEPVHNHHSHLLCWKSVFAGILISIMSYMVLSALGLGLVGILAQSAIENEQGGLALATGSGVWMGLSAVVSIFLGSYFAVRISKFVTTKLGAAHGFVIASAFFILLISMAGSAIGTFATGVGHLASGLGQSAAAVGTNQRVQDTINNALGSTTLKSDPRVVAEGLTARLIQGDTESAKSYYAYQTGMTGAEVDAKIAQLQADFNRAAKDVGDKAAAVTSATGWSLFVTFIVGLIGALFGGRVAAQANMTRPLTVETEMEVQSSYRVGVLANQRGSAMPYIFAWILGVPASILFLIYCLRAVF
jgi:hypothetical protein